MGWLSPWERRSRETTALGMILPKPSQESPALQMVVASLHTALSIEGVLHHIQDGMVQVLGYSGLIVSLLDEDRRVFKWSILHTSEKLEILTNVKTISGIETPAQRHYSKFGDALLDGRVYISHNFHDIAEKSLDKDICFAIQRAMGAETFISVPLLDKGNSVGCIIVATSKGKVSEEEREALTAFAAEAGASIRRIKLTQQGKDRELAAMQMITASIQSTLELEQVLQQICKTVVDDIGYDNAVIWLHDKDKRLLKGSALYSKGGSWLIGKVEGIVGQRIIGLEVPARRDYNMSVGMILDGKVCLTHSLHELATPSLDEAACSAIQELIGAKTLAAVPMLCKGRLVGDLLVTISRNEVTEGEIDSLVAFANQAGMAIENAQLFSEIEAKARELEESEGKYKQLVEDINDGYLVAQDGKLVFANRRCAELFGYKLEESLDRPLEDFVPMERQNLLVEQCEKVMRGEVSSERYEWEVVRKDGAIAPVELSTKSIYYQDRPAISALITDITERKRAEEELKKVKEDLEQRVRERTAKLEETSATLERREQQRSALLLAIAHEFKVPLTSIKTMADLLAEELGRDAQSPQAKMVDNIRRSVGKVERRLADLLDFARMQTATMELQLQPTNVGTAIEEVISLCSPFIASKKQTLTVEVSDPLPQAMLDQLQLERIITNLLTNASKFTSEGGKIELRARAEDDSLVVQVRDSGVGIAESELGQIFEPYYRGKSSKPRDSGLGLGLAIVKELVGLHQGKVWVESKLGKGSTFSFSLPLRNGKGTEPGERVGKGSESSGD